MRARRRRLRLVRDHLPGRGLSLGEHVFRARATDRAGNLDATPAERRFTVTNAAPGRDPRLGPRHRPRAAHGRREVGGTDADGDRLTYELDFGDGQTADGAPPASLAHRYDATGVYTVRLTVRDGRAPRPRPTRR